MGDYKLKDSLTPKTGAIFGGLVGIIATGTALHEYYPEVMQYYSNKEIIEEGFNMVLISAGAFSLGGYISQKLHKYFYK